MKSRLSRFWNALKASGKRFMEIDPLTEASSLAYTTIFALPGVFIIALTVASWFYDADDVREALYTQAGSMVGPETSKQLQSMVDNASETKRGIFARILGIVALVVSATAAFASLQGSLNKVWRVKAKSGRAVVRYLLTRAISLGLIAAFGFLLLVSLVVDSALVAAGERIGGIADEGSVVMAVAALIISFAIVTCIFAMIFKFLPDVKIEWHAVWVGALFTSALFSLGKYLIGIYIAQTDAGSAYGAGGAVIIIMIWVYYSSLILLFGAQYTQYVTVRDDGPVKPEPQARAVTPPAR